MWTLGRAKVDPIHIFMDPNTKPVQQKQRKVALHFIPRLKKHLEVLKGAGVVSGPLKSEDATGWVSNPVRPKLVDSFTKFKMLLPGTSLSFAGEEPGLESIDWDAVTAQMEGNMSLLKLFPTLANKLRHQEAILFGMLDRNSTFVTSETVFGLSRVKKGNPRYLLTINFGTEEKTVDMSGGETIPASIRVMSRSGTAGDVPGVETFCKTADMCQLPAPRLQGGGRTLMS